MGDFLRSEPGIRLACFAGVFVVMAVWECLAPRRRLSLGKTSRWTSNLALLLLNGFLMRLVAPLGAVGVALVAQRQGWGLFQLMEIPSWLAIALSVLLLDLAIYLQHVMFHAVPLLWRLHLVHHADMDFDVTTGLRFHSLEILLSLGIKAAVILLLGTPVMAVLIFEVLLNATSMFNHSNIRMPLGLDRVLRYLVVTPDMHRVHHSRHVAETNSNFGFSLPWWDWLLGTYRDQPLGGHLAMGIGLFQLRHERQTQRLHRMLWLPIDAPAGDNSVKRGANDGDEQAPVVDQAAGAGQTTGLGEPSYRGDPSLGKLTAESTRTVEQQ